MPDRGVELYLRPDVALFVFPTHDGLMSLFTCWPRRRLSGVRADIEGSVLSAIDQAPELAARVRSGRRVERFYGAAELPNFRRKPQGPGWALVGDAGYHKDPFLALGISDALRDADQLVAAADAGLSGRVPLGAALAEHERLRNLASQEDYQLNLFLAQFRPLPSELLAQRAAVRTSNDQEAINSLLLAGQGSLGREPSPAPALMFDAGRPSPIAMKRPPPEPPSHSERSAVSAL